MKNLLPLVLCLCTWDFFIFFSCAVPDEIQELWSTPASAQSTREYRYERFEEVQKQCGPILSSASEIKPDYKRWFSMQNELSFRNGDWDQESGGAPLMPFIEPIGVINSSRTNISSPQITLQNKNISTHGPPLHLVSFSVDNVDPYHGSKNMVNVSGVLTLGITSDQLPYGQYSQSPEFQIWSGYSVLTIMFEGVYVERENNGLERVFCMLGNSNLPSREPDSTNPWKWVKNVASGKPPLLQDDQILLVLHYPSTFTLTSRVIRGELKSLNKKSNLKYFDEVNISSQLGATSNYQFRSEKLVSKACDPYPYHDDLMDSQIEVYKGSELCGFLDQVAHEALRVVPNWKCNVTDEYCSKLGPFKTEKEIKAWHGGLGNVRLMMQDVRCEPGFDIKGGSTARISAIFRAMPPFEDYYRASERTGLSGTTLSAEGRWNSSSGQICMVGCVGLASEGPDRCDSRICLYLPITFSITQRSIIYGSISDLNMTASYFPLSFERVGRPTEIFNRFSTSRLSYKYSKFKAAGAFLERNEPFDLTTIIKKSLLSYPKLNGGHQLVSLSVLSEDLTLNVNGVPEPRPKVHSRRPFIHMEVLSLGPLLGRYWMVENESGVEIQFEDKPKTTKRELLLNVSAELNIDGESYTNVSQLFLEGLYDPFSGRMFLIGCRDVRASWRILFDSGDLERGLDCSIEVKVEYPPTTTRWLVNPAAKISITSQRNEDDPLHFSSVQLVTVPILYRKQREDILSRRGVEGILRILSLTLVVACIFSQLLYIRDKVDVVSFISLVMIGVQALGYSLPLVTGAEALFARMASESYNSPSYDLEKNLPLRVIDYLVKLLVLVALLLTLRLFQKVWKARIRLLTRTPLEPGRVPSDKRVLLTTFLIHAIGFIMVLVVHSMNASKRPVKSEEYIDSQGNSHAMREWLTELEEYVGLVQDFFLLPQIIGNLLWHVNSQPLRKVYYIGATVVRLLPHAYDYIRAPVFNPYFSEEYEFVNPDLDFYSKFGDIAIPITATLLACIVFIQQRWSYRKLSETLTLGKRKLLPLGSKDYERLPSKSFEAELVSGVNEIVTHRDGHLRQSEE